MARISFLLRRRSPETIRGQIIEPLAGRRSAALPPDVHQRHHRQPKGWPHRTGGYPALTSPHPTPTYYQDIPSPKTSTGAWPTICWYHRPFLQSSTPMALRRHQASTRRRPASPTLACPWAHRTASTSTFSTRPPTATACRKAGAMRRRSTLPHFKHMPPFGEPIEPRTGSFQTLRKPLAGRASNQVRHLVRRNRSLPLQHKPSLDSHEPCIAGPPCSNLIRSIWDRTKRSASSSGELRQHRMSQSLPGIMQTHLVDSNASSRSTHKYNRIRRQVGLRDWP